MRGFVLRLNQRRAFISHSQANFTSQSNTKEPASSYAMTVQNQESYIYSIPNLRQKITT
jgi:hypothetical protein